MASAIRQMPVAVFLFFTALPLLAAAGCLFGVTRARRQAAVITATPTSNIGMAHDGYCELEGRSEAIDGQLLTAPLTKAACVWYSAKVEQWIRRSKMDSEGQWTVVKEYTSTAPFFLRDGTGVCTVHPWAAEITPSDRSQWFGTTRVPTDRNPPRLDPLESAQPLVGSNAPFRYSEERLYADAPLLVLGEFHQGRFDRIDDEENDGADEALEAGADDVRDEEEDAGEDDFDESGDVDDKLGELAVATTRAWIARGAGAKPFIITTKLQAMHVATSEMGAQAGMALAAALAGAAAFMLLARYA